MYIFAYRERKDIAYSAFKQNLEKTVISYLLITILLVIAWMVYSFSDFDKNNPLKFYSSIIILALLWLINLIFVYRKTIFSINIFKVINLHLTILEENTLRLSKILKSKEKRGYSGLLNKTIDYYHIFLLKKLLKKISISSEIVFQIFLSKIKYNLPKDFSERLEIHLALLSNLIKEVHVNNYEQIIAFRLENESINLYDTVLQKANLLLSNTSKNLWSEDTDKIISFYQDTLPGIYQINKELFHSVFKSDPKKLLDFINTSQKRELIYYKNINSVISILSANNHQDSLKLLKMIMDQSNDSYEFVKGTNIFTIYFSLMTQAVVKNDVKLLTNVTNLALQLAESEYLLYSEDIDDLNDLDDEELTDLSSKRFSLAKINILCIVKAIELGHYGCAGFLIKVSINKLKELNINDHCYEVYNFVKQQKADDAFRLHEILNIDINPELLNKLGIHLTFSPTSFNYCYSKAMFLIYCQENYMKDMGILNIRHSELLRIDDFIFDTNINYLKIKVSGLNKEYGLSFLKDEKYISQPVRLN